jgi:hypothetical protein
VMILVLVLVFWIGVLVLVEVEVGSRRFWVVVVRVVVAHARVVLVHHGVERSLDLVVGMAVCWDHFVVWGRSVSVVGWTQLTERWFVSESLRGSR